MRKILSTTLLLLLLVTPKTSANTTALDAINQAFAPAHRKNATRVAKCESSLNPKATNRNSNGTTDYGLFQMNDGGTMQEVGLSRKQALNPYANARAAARLHRRYGWKRWVCAKKLGIR